MPELGYDSSLEEPRVASIEQSRKHLSKAWNELAKGYRAEASEYGWLAAAEMAKVIGVKRGWACSTEHEMIDAIKALDRESQGSQLSGLFISCYYSHCSFLDFDHPSEFIETTLNKVERFVDKAEALLDAPA